MKQIATTEWAGVVFGHPSDPIKTSHRTELTGLGLTIVGEESRAGETRFFVYGPIRAVASLLEPDIRTKLPGFFFKIKKGDPLTLETVKRWTTDAARVLRED